MPQAITATSVSIVPASVSTACRAPLAEIRTPVTRVPAAPRAPTTPKGSPRHFGLDRPRVRFHRLQGSPGRDPDARHPRPGQDLDAQVTRGLCQREGGAVRIECTVVRYPYRSIQRV